MTCTSFNEAPPIQAGKQGWHRSIRCRQSRFNEAPPIQAGKPGNPQFSGPVAWTASMRPHLFRRGKRCLEGAHSSVVRPLQ